jgi:hypothetical protein
MAKYKKNDPSVVNALGAQYSQTPTPELGAQLLDAFEGFIQNYVTLLSPTRKTKVRLTKNTREFLALLAKKEEFAQNGQKTYDKILKRLPNMAKQSLLDDEDLRQSIVLAFLTTAQKFDPAKCKGTGTFTGYIDKHFKYALKPLLFDSHEDASKHQPLYNEVIEEQPFFGSDVDFEGEQANVHVGHEIVDDMLVDKIIGIPISSPEPPFDTLLTKQERLIMIKMLVERKSPSAIAVELDYSSAVTVRDKYNSAINKLRSHYNVDIEGEAQWKF